MFVFIDFIHSIFETLRYLSIKPTGFSLIIRLLHKINMLETDLKQEVYDTIAMKKQLHMT